jgi:hypothetical protein
LGSFEQDSSVRELTGRSAASRSQALALFSFGFGEDNGILFLRNS